MKLEEAHQILHDNGFLMENITEDILSDILWDNLNTDTNTSMQGIRKVCDFLEYDLGKPIERASVKRIAETIVKLYNLGYESERFHPNHQRKIELKDAMKAAALIKAKAKETMTENFILEGSMSLEDKIDNSKIFNAVNEEKENIIAAFKAIKTMVGKNGWKFEEDSNPDDFFTLKEITDGTLERVIKQNKGFSTIIINLKKTLNKFDDIAEIRLVVTSQGNAEIKVTTNDNNKKSFDVSEYQTAIKYANWIH
jgi:hypothetical protein